jgi:hypothetical protein
MMFSSLPHRQMPETWIILEPIVRRFRICLSFPASFMNPYRAEAGSELDAQIELQLFQNSRSGPVPPYSTSLEEGQQVLAKLRKDYGLRVTMGSTRLPNRPWFARYGSDPSTSTEVIAETLPLALCRLALLACARHPRTAEAPRRMRDIFRSLVAG